MLIVATMMTKIYDATDDYIDCNNDADDYYGDIANYDDMMINDMMTIMMRRATTGRRRLRGLKTLLQVSGW